MVGLQSLDTTKLSRVAPMVLDICSSLWGELGMDRSNVPSFQVARDPSVLVFSSDRMRSPADGWSPAHWTTLDAR